MLFVHELSLKKKKYIFKHCASVVVIGNLWQERGIYGTSPL